MDTHDVCKDIPVGEYTPRPYSVRLTLALGVAAVVVAGLLLGAKVYMDRSRILGGAGHEVEFAADLVAANMEGAMFGVHQMLTGVKAYIQMVGEMDAGAALVRKHLLMLKGLDPMVLDMLVLDSGGRISSWTGRGLPPDVSGMEYAGLPEDDASEAPAPLASSLHTPEMLRVSGPHESPVQPGRKCFAASMPLHGGQQGEWATLVVLLDLGLLHRRFREVDLPPGADIAVSTPSGELLSSSLRGDVAGWKNPELAALWEGEASRGVRTLRDPIKGREYITAFTKVPMNGLLALGFRDKGMLLEQWRGQAVRTMLAGLALACFVAPVTFYSMRDQVRMARMAATDGLTGLPNRATFMRTGREEIERARRYGHEAAALIIDIDLFKQVNDTHGHDVGDRAIQALARILVEACRSTDLPCRYGGEEFAMLLPETDAAGALVAAEKVRSLVEAEYVPAASGCVRLTCSVGAAVWRGGDEELDELLKRADTALYAAKEGGRNQVRQG